MMRVLIVDDHPAFIVALKDLLRRMHSDIVIDSAISAEHALCQVEHCPEYQFILLDLNMPGLDGFAFMRALRQRKIPIPVIIISSSEAPETVHACINAGAAGYIPKSYQLEQMAQAIQCIQSGEVYLPQAFVSSTVLIDEVAVQQRCQQIGISQKSYQVLQRLSKGLTNKEIARELHVSVHTVKAHLARLFERLHTKNRMETVREAIRLQLIDG